MQQQMLGMDLDGSRSLKKDTIQQVRHLRIGLDTEADSM